MTVSNLVQATIAIIAGVVLHSLITKVVAGPFDQHSIAGVVLGGKGSIAGAAGRPMKSTHSKLDPSLPVNIRLAEPLAQTSPPHHLSHRQLPEPGLPLQPLGPKRELELASHIPHKHTHCEKQRPQHTPRHLLARFQLQEHAVVDVVPDSHVRAHGLGALVPVFDVLRSLVGGVDDAPEGGADAGDGHGTAVAVEHDYGGRAGHAPDVGVGEVGEGGAGGR